MMIETVVDVRVEKPYVLDVTFADGTRRRVDVEPFLYGEVFEPLRDPDRFAEAFVDEELGTVVWPNGADLSPEFLYAGGKPHPEPKAHRPAKVKTLRYIVVYEQTPNNWFAYVPDLPGCSAAAKTRAEAERLIREALRYRLEAIVADHEPVPRSGAWTEEVTVTVPR